MAPEPFAITEIAEEGRRTLSLSGELDIAAAALLEARVAALCRQHGGEIVLDLGRIAFVDSSGLNAILRMKALCEEDLCDFYLTPGPAPVRRPFDITRLIDRLPFRRSARDDDSDATAG
ncbi:MAG TPA: STAS domain-containing protein [Solirubrobacteraceae bacterium]|jgi:anti-anti-sigma factor